MRKPWWQNYAGWTRISDFDIISVDFGTWRSARLSGGPGEGRMDQRKGISCRYYQKGSEQYE